MSMSVNENARVIAESEILIAAEPETAYVCARFPTYSPAFWASG
jgi:hypothetical protein